MNLYDSYMTSRDRAACPPEVQEVLAAVRPERPMPPEGGGAPCSYPSLAMVYAPYQEFRMLYGHEEALSRGTLFRELDKPLEAGGKR